LRRHGRNAHGVIGEQLQAIAIGGNFQLHKSGRAGQLAERHLPPLGRYGQPRAVGQALVETTRMHPQLAILVLGRFGRRLLEER